MGLGYNDIEDGQISCFILIKSCGINGKILAEWEGRGSQAARGSQDAGQWVWFGFFFLMTPHFAKEKGEAQRFSCSESSGTRFAYIQMSSGKATAISQKKYICHSFCVSTQLCQSKPIHPGHLLAGVPNAFDHHDIHRCTWTSKENGTQFLVYPICT